MTMTVTLENEDIIEVRRMMAKGFDEIEKFIKNPDQNLIPQILETIKEQKCSFDSFLSNADRINIYVEKKMTKTKPSSHKKSKKSKWGVLD